MSVTISTERFKKAVSKAVKGASSNALLPITSMLGIKVTGGKLILSTTDKSNTLQVIIDKVQGEEFDVTVQVDLFSKLISKITSENIKLKAFDGELIVTANGEYKLPLVADEEGLVSFPEINFAKPKKQTGMILLSSIMSVFDTNRASLAQTLDLPCVTGYYIGDKVITTDGNVICFNCIKVMGEGTVLIPPQMMNLLTLNTSEKIKYYKKGQFMLFETDDIVIFGQELEGIEDFPVEEINTYLEEDFPSSCILPKSIMQSVLDRLSLFIETYDKNGAYFTFTKSGIQVSSKHSSSVENIAYVESTEFSPFTCCVDIPMLKQQLDSVPSDTISLHYGNENAFKIVSGNVIQVISLLGDDELEMKQEEETEDSEGE